MVSVLVVKSKRRLSVVLVMMLIWVNVVFLYIARNYLPSPLFWVRGRLRKLGGNNRNRPASFNSALIGGIQRESSSGVGSGKVTLPR